MKDSKSVKTEGQQSKTVDNFTYQVIITKNFSDGTSEEVANKKEFFTKRSIKNHTKLVRNTAENKKVYDGLIDEATLENEYLRINCSDMYSTSLLDKEVIADDKNNKERGLFADMKVYFGSKAEFEAIVKKSQAEKAVKADKDSRDII